MDGYVLFTRGSAFIRISTDDGESWEMISPSVDGHNPQWMDFTWEVADTPSKQAIIRITDYIDAQLFDQSDGYFEIRTPDVDPIIAVCSTTAAPSAWAGALLMALAVWRRRSGAAR